MRKNIKSGSLCTSSPASLLFRPTTLAIAISIATTAPVGAATINVGAGCSVVEAVTAANDNVVVNSCTAGDDNADTVVLLAATTHSISVASFFTDIGDGMGTLEPNSAFPLITSDITIEGNGSTIERDAGAATDFRLFYVYTGATLNMESVTLSNGNADGASGSARSGGAIYNRLGTVSLDSVTISNNTANVRGGGISSRGDLTVVNSLVTANTVTGAHSNGEGGGINLGGNASLVLTNSSVTNNKAINAGGIKSYNTPSGATIEDSFITGNSATFSGGGMSFFNSDLSISGTTISNNYGKSRGSAIEVFEGSETVQNVFVMDNCTINSNIGDGSTVGSGVTSTISNSSITQNSFYSAYASGQALYAGPKAVSLDNLVVSQNDGYGIWAKGPSLTVSNSTATLNSGRGAVLMSATVTNSTFNSNSGGGLYLSYGSGSYLTIDGNSAQYGVGGLLATSSSLDHITISNNSTGGSGGGLQGQNFQIESSSITGNSATQSGGGAYLTGSNPSSLTDLYIAYNESKTGGGIFSTDGNLELSKINLVSNSATNGRGGGIHLRQSTATISNSTINGSSASGYGGGIYAGFKSDLVVQGSTVSGNRSASTGGGLFVGSANIEVTNSTFFANSATQYGGAVSARSNYYTTLIKNSTITSNTASSGGGIDTNSSTPMLTLEATIIDKSTGGDCYNAPLDGKNNWFEDASCNGVASGSPMLGAATGSPVVFPLLAGSGAIDAGGECGLETDQIGTPRSICKCDIGAYEVLELSPDNSSCKSSFFVIPTPNGGMTVIDL